MNDWTKLQVLAKDAAGKTVKNILVKSNEVVIVYTDGTYSHFQSDARVYDDDDFESFIVEFNLSDFLDSYSLMREVAFTLIDAGVLPEEESVFSIVEKARKDALANQAKLIEKAERDEYERLKAKFEPKKQ